MEIWRTIEFLDNKYSVSNLGRIKNNKFNRILKDRTFKNKGYKIISVKLNNKMKTYFIHRLVLLAFKPIDNPDNYDVHHIDMDRSNNNLSNLQWLSSLQNQKIKKHNTKSFKIFSDLLIEFGDSELYNKLLEIKKGS